MIITNKCPYLLFGERISDPLQICIGRLNCLYNLNAALKPLRIISCWQHKYWYRSTIHLAFIAFSSVSPRDTLKSACCITFSSCCETCSEKHALHLLELKDMTTLLTVMSSGWNKFVRLCGTIAEWQICFLLRSIITVTLSFENAHDYQRHLLFWII